MAKKTNNNSFGSRKSAVPNIPVLSKEQVRKKLESSTLFGSSPSPAVPVIRDEKRVPSKGPLLLTIPDLCKLLNCSRSKIVRMQNSGSLPGRIDLGGSVRYHRETIEEWLRVLAGDLSKS